MYDISNDELKYTILILVLCIVFILLFQPLKNSFRFLTCRKKVSAICKSLHINPIYHWYQHSVTYQYYYKGKEYVSTDKYLSWSERHYGPMEGEKFDLYICVKRPKSFKHPNIIFDDLFMSLLGIALILVSIIVFIT